MYIILYIFLRIISFKTKFFSEKKILYTVLYKYYNKDIMSTLLPHKGNIDDFFPLHYGFEL